MLKEQSILEDAETTSVFQWIFVKKPKQRGCGKVQKVSLHERDLKDPVKDPELRVMVNVSLYQDVEWSAAESSVLAKSQEMTSKVKAKTRAPLKETEAIFLSLFFLFHFPFA